MYELATGFYVKFQVNESIGLCLQLCILPCFHFKILLDLFASGTRIRLNPAAPESTNCRPTAGQRV